jgi:hypothetical protein
MSYVNIPPAYYAQMRPDTPYHPGGEGWLRANVTGWGENPNVAWAKMQAVNGYGDAAPPVAPAAPAPFTYVAPYPFSAYYRPGNAPWGRYPQGPAYAVPRPNLCPTCVGGNPIAPGVGALAADCGPCQIDNGAGGCVPCPDGADLPECTGCVNGAPPPPSIVANPFVSAVAVGVLTMVATGVVFALLKKSTKIPVN